MTAGRVFLGLSFSMVFSLQLASKSTDNLSWAFVTIRGTKHCPWIASSCSNLLQFFTNSVSQSWSASTNHDVLEISIQDGLFPKDVLRKQQRRALIAMQQCTHIKLNYSAKFSHLTKTKTKRWFKARIAYYPNSVATFNFNALTISLSGDVHPLPGPINRGFLSDVLTAKKRRPAALAHVMNRTA